MKAIALAALLLATAPAWAHDEHAHHGASGEYPWGRPGEASHVTRTVRIDMGDELRYTPDRIDAKRGDTLKLVVHNAGKMPHEMVIGTEPGLREHAEAMRKHPGMEHHDPYMVQVAPGGTGEIVWTFSRPGSFAFGCLVPGHWEGGMKGTITVKP